jgi:hypothetical protein
MRVRILSFKLMRIRIQILTFNLMRIQIPPLTFSQIWTLQNDLLNLPPFQFDADPDQSFHFDPDTDPAFHFDADPDPASQNDGDPCESRSATPGRKYTVKNI